LELDLESFSVCLFVYLGFAFRRNLYICIPAAHPPGRAGGKDCFGEGRQRAGGGPGGQALQYTLPGETQRGSVYPEEICAQNFLCAVYLILLKEGSLTSYLTEPHATDYPLLLLHLLK